MTPARGRNLASSREEAVASVVSEERGDRRERLELLEVAVHRMQEQLTSSSGGEVAELPGTRLWRSAYGDALGQPQGRRTFRRGSGSGAREHGARCPPLRHTRACRWGTRRSFVPPRAARPRGCAAARGMRRTARSRRRASHRRCVRRAVAPAGCPSFRPTPTYRQRTERSSSPTASLSRSAEAEVYVTPSGATASCSRTGSRGESRFCALRGTAAPSAARRA
jgi:hypothetical protein